jgi:hypothetical protein
LVLFVPLIPQLVGDKFSLPDRFITVSIPANETPAGIEWNQLEHI